MTGIGKQSGTAVCCRLAFPRTAHRLERRFPSQTQGRLSLPRPLPERRAALHLTPQRQHFPRRLGKSTTYGYDADGNQTSVTDPLSHAVTYGYNALSEMTLMKDALGNQTTYGYDADGNQTLVTDPLGHTTTSTYNAQGQVLSMTNALSGVTSYGYDSMGDETSITDLDNNTTTFAYNSAGQLTSETNPMGYATTYSYNNFNAMTSTTDADGRRITYSYNHSGQETGETWWQNMSQTLYTATYSYNTDGQLTAVSDPYSSYTYTYNAAGEEASVSNRGTPGVPTVTLSFGYDVYGNRTSLSDNLGGSISYAYNADQEMTSLGLSVSSAFDAQVTFAYDPAGRLTGLTRTAPSVSGDTISSSYSYDKADELTNITNVDTSKSVTLANYTYGYDKTGELTSYQDNSGNSLTYGYDKVGELTGATGTLASKSYTFIYNYDLNGNRTTTSTDVNGTLTTATYSTGSGNEMTSDGTYSYTYDHDGNMLTQTNIATGTVTYYTWDYENRLTEEKVETSGGTVLEDEKFTYDVFGNRIGVSLNGTQQLYTVYDGSNPYMDFNGSGALTERYLTNPDGLNDFYGQVSASGTTEWFLTDNINSIRQVISTSGSVLDAITYDPYGVILNQTNSANEPRFLYTGAAYDSITGTYLDGARENNPTDGRWESPDPSGLGPDSNPYRYVGDAPTNYIDPLGTWRILLQADAFIGNHIGGPWFPEPGSLWNNWEFKGDERDFGGKFEDSRLRSWATLDSSVVGFANRGDVVFHTDTGFSHRRRQVRHWYAWGLRSYLAWEYSEPLQQTDISKTYSVENVHERPGFLETAIKMTAAAGYPYTSSPTIDYTFIFYIAHRPHTNKYFVSISYEHNQFPDYEALVNRQLDYKYVTKDDGPGLFNLTLLSVRGRTRWFQITQGD